MELKPGLKLTSAGSSAEFIVIRGAGPAELTVAGTPLGVAGTPEAQESVEQGGHSESELLIGKRYTDATGAIELLCTRSGAGPLFINGVQVEAGQAKALPSSD